MKIIIRQIPFEQQIFDPIEDWGFEGNFAIEGNKRLSSFCHSKAFQKIKETLEDGEIFDALDSMEEEGNCYWLPYSKYSFQVIQEYLPKENGSRYSIKELLALKKALNDWSRDCDDDYFTDILSIVTSKDWEVTTIRGYSQSDWNNIFYVKNEIDIETIAAAYFGMWSEWAIEKGAEDEIGVCYQILDNVDDIKEYFANIFKTSKDNIMLLVCDGLTYKEV